MDFNTFKTIAKDIADIGGLISLLVVALLYGIGIFRKSKDARDLTELQLEQAKNETLTDALNTANKRISDLQDRLAKLVDMAQVKELLETMGSMFSDSLANIDSRAQERHEKAMRLNEEMISAVKANTAANTAALDAIRNEAIEKAVSTRIRTMKKQNGAKPRTIRTISVEQTSP